MFELIIALLVGLGLYMFFHKGNSDEPSPTHGNDETLSTKTDKISAGLDTFSTGLAKFNTKLAKFNTELMERQQDYRRKVELGKEFNEWERTIRAIIEYSLVSAEKLEKLHQTIYPKERFNRHNKENLICQMFDKNFSFPEIFPPRPIQPDIHDSSDDNVIRVQEHQAAEARLLEIISEVSSELRKQDQLKDFFIFEVLRHNGGENVLRWYFPEIWVYDERLAQGKELSIIDKARRYVIRL
jgi:hypothetical protein